MLQRQIHRERLSQLTVEQNLNLFEPVQPQHIPRACKFIPILNLFHLKTCQFLSFKFKIKVHQNPIGFIKTTPLHHQYVHSSNRNGKLYNHQLITQTAILRNSILTSHSYQWILFRIQVQCRVVKNKV